MVVVLIGGLVGKVVVVEDIYVVDFNVDVLQVFKDKFGVMIVQFIDGIFVNVDVVVLVVKLQQMCEVVVSLKFFIGVQLIVLIVVGICMVDLLCWLDGYQVIVCVMFNILVLIGKGILGVVLYVQVLILQCVQVDFIFKVVGEILWLDSEEKFDVVIVVFGSGLVYVFYFFEVMEQVVV